MVQISERDREIQTLEQIIFEKDQALVNLKRNVLQKDALIKKIYGKLQFSESSNKGLEEMISRGFKELETVYQKLTEKTQMTIKFERELFLKNTKIQEMDANYRKQLGIIAGLKKELDEKNKGSEICRKPIIDRFSKRATLLFRRIPKEK